jgi:hypothetical protein
VPWGSIETSIVKVDAGVIIWVEGMTATSAAFACPIIIRSPYMSNVNPLILMITEFCEHCYEPYGHCQKNAFMNKKEIE